MMTVNNVGYGVVFLFIWNFVSISIVATSYILLRYGVDKIVTDYVYFSSILVCYPLSTLAFMWTVMWILELKYRQAINLI